jgi:ADP-ribosylation factor protein 1
MGISLSKNSIRNLFKRSKKVRLLMLGLDNAGKTTLLYKLKLNEQVTTIPTIGFNVESVQYKNIQMTIWDVGGQYRIRKLWEYYFNSTNALIFVMDSNDIQRIEEVKEELYTTLNHDENQKKPLLLYANKQDMEDSLSSEDITVRLGLTTIHSRPWMVQPCSAKTGEGIYEGLEWLSKKIDE